VELLHSLAFRNTIYEYIYTLNVKIISSSTSKAFMEKNYVQIPVTVENPSTFLCLARSIQTTPIQPSHLTLRRLMSYIYMEHPFLMFLDHTQRRSTVGRTPLDE